MINVNSVYTMEKGMEPEIVSGKVTKVIFRPLSWKLRTPEGNVFTCTPDRPGRYFPVREGDYITAIMFVKGKEERVLAPDRLPAVEIQHTEESLTKLITNHLYSQRSEAESEYSLLGGIVDDVVNQLNLAAQFLHDTGKSQLPLLSESITSEDGKVVTADKLLHWWFKNVILRQLEVMGVSKRDHYGSYWLNELELLEKIKQNPFSVPCLPREVASQIYSAYDTWYPHVTPEMMELGAIMYSIYLKYKDGWSAVSKSYLLKTWPEIGKNLVQLIQQEKMVYDFDCLYFEHTHKVEVELAKKIEKLALSPDSPEVTVEMKPGIQPLSEEQMEAIKLALIKPISIITGGAGTGKSTTTAHLLHNLAASGIEYAVAAFTGKAVSRIKEVMDIVGDKLSGSADTYRYRPMTLHRLIREGQGRGVDKVKITCLVIDEASMVASDLMYQVLNTYQTIEKLILVGDVNQLQPIEWGSMFCQLVESGKVPVARLHTNFRTYLENGEHDGIIRNANDLLLTKQGTIYKWHTGSNFSLYEGGIKETVDMVRSCFQSGITTKQLVVLCPYNGSFSMEGVDQLNKALQPIFTEGNPFLIDNSGKKWAVGDRVMMTKNNKNEGIYNGDLGDVVQVVDFTFVFSFGRNKVTLPRTECSSYMVEHSGWYILVRDCQGAKAGDKTNIFSVGQKSVMVQFKEGGVKAFMVREQDKQQKELEEFINKEDSNSLTTSMLDHAFALTVNKSQGSEWDFVLISLPKIGKGSFLNRNLMYTALTRAKRCVWIVTKDHRHLSTAVTNRPSMRVDNLRLRLTDLPNVAKSQETSSRGLRQMDSCDFDDFYDDCDDDYGVAASY